MMLIGHRAEAGKHSKFKVLLLHKTSYSTLLCFTAHAVINFLTASCIATLNYRAHDKQHSTHSTQACIDHLERLTFLRG